MIAANPFRYLPRKVFDLGIVSGAWTAKVYAVISEAWKEQDLPTREQIAAAVSEAMAGLQGELDHELGFAIFHLANDGQYLLLTRFSNANNLRHIVSSVTVTEGALKLARLSDPMTIACVWELRLMMFEADAWIETVLREGLTTATAQQYLARRYCGSV